MSLSFLIGMKRCGWERLSIWLARRAAIALASLGLISAESAKEASDPILRSAQPSRSPLRAARVSTPSKADADAKLEFSFFERCRPNATPCEISDASCQREIYEAVQCLTGTRMHKRPPLLLAAVTPQEELVPASLERAASRLGLASGVVDSTLHEAANAYYAPRLGAIVLRRAESESGANEQAVFTLAHEYVHALQDREHALRDSLVTRGQRTFDEELAIFSLWEGQAALYEEVLRALVRGQAPASWARARFASITALNDEAIVRQRRPLGASFASFPYTYGANWAASRWLGSGESGLGGTPAASTREIMATRYGWPAAVERACPEARPESLEAVWTRGASDSLGAWILQTYVRLHTKDAARAQLAARNFRGDRIVIYAAAAREEPGFVWRTCWSSPESAVEMSALIEAQLRQHALGGGTLSVTVHANDVIAVVLDG